MNWEQWFCVNQACTTEAWMVQRDYAMSDIWRVAAHVDDHPFTVAATGPVCPRCGRALCSPPTLARRIDDNILETGKVLEFAGRLPH